MPKKLPSKSFAESISDLQPRAAQPRVAVDANVAKARERTPAPALKIETENGVDKFSIDHPDKMLGLNLLMEATGTTDVKFLHGLIGQLVNAGSKNGKPVEDDVNFVLAVVKGVEPRDQFEAMLAAQMAAVHIQTMASARKLANAKYLPQQDSAERGFNKLARTYTMEMDALKRYRTGGQQKVTVEHVTVNEGGQAIVGNVATGGRGNGKKRR